MQEALFSALLHPQTWFYDSLAARHTAALTECEFQTTSGQPCRCVKYLMKDISNELADWRWSHFQTLLVDILFDNSCASYCSLANRLPKEIAFYCDCGILAREEADPLKSARQFNGPGGQTSAKRPRVQGCDREALRVGRHETQHSCIFYGHLLSKDSHRLHCQGAQVEQTGVPESNALHRGCLHG